MAAAEQITLLLIEPDPRERAAIQGAINALDTGMTLVAAPSISTALPFFRQQRFDCVIAGIQLTTSDLLALRAAIAGPPPTPLLRICAEEPPPGATDSADILLRSELSPPRLALALRRAIRIGQAERRAALEAEHEAHLALLSQVSVSLSHSADPSAILALLVPQLADWCALDMFQRDGTLLRSGVSPAAGIDPAADELAQLWAAQSVGAERLTVVQDSESGQTGAAFLAVPIVFRDATYGLLCLARRSGQRPFSPADTSLSSQICHLIGAAAEHARLDREVRGALNLRDSFFSVTAHELRTPLTSLLGYAQLLERRLGRRPDLDERDARALQVISEQALRLNGMIGDLLDVSRLQSGTLHLKRSEVHLGALLERASAELKMRPYPHSIDLADDAPMTISGDAERIRKALDCLLDNAQKFSPPGSPITLTLRRHGNWAALSVTDSGQGIPSDEMERIFECFYRGEAARSQQIGGMGLGLFIARRIVEMLDGSLDVHSTPGRGSTFTLQLPLQAYVGSPER